MTVDHQLVTHQHEGSHIRDMDSHNVERFPYQDVDQLETATNPRNKRQDLEGQEDVEDSRDFQHTHLSS